MRILLVPRALVILRAVILPVSQTHPTEVILAPETLHVVASSVLLNTNVTLWTVFGVCTDVIRCLTVVSAFSQPALDRGTVRGCMVVIPTDEAEGEGTPSTDDSLWTAIRAAHNDLAIRTRTPAELWMVLDKVPERKLLVLLTEHGSSDEIGQDHILRSTHIAIAGHTADSRGYTLSDLTLKVHHPTLATECVAATETLKAVWIVGGVAYGTGVGGGGE